MRPFIGVLEFLKRRSRRRGPGFGEFGPATSVTSLAVMAFLAAGHVPGDPGPYRESIERGIQYVLAHQHPNGLLVSRSANGPMYCHGISTLMLAEIAGMTADRELSARVPGGSRSGCQADSGRPGRSQERRSCRRLALSSEHSNDSDISVTGWQLMAPAGGQVRGLRSAIEQHRLGPSRT